MDPVHVLIVDDEHQFVDAVVERLRLRGFNADGATSGQDAMELLRQRPYDVVVLDVKMPGVGGFNVIRKIKEEWPNLRVVLITGHGSSQDAEEGLQLGAFRYLMKPVSIEDLISVFPAASGSKQDARQ